MQFGNNAYQGDDVAGMEFDDVVMAYTEVSGTIPGGTEEVFVRVTTTTVEGFVERVGYEVYRGTSAVTDTHEVWTIACVTINPELGNGTLNFIKHMLAGTDDGVNLYASAGHIVSRTWTYDGGHTDEYKTARRLSSDGQVALYDYSGNDVVVMEQGYADDPLAASPTMVYGTRTTTKTDAAGNLASSLVERVVQGINSGNYFTVSYMETGDTDVFGRPLRTDYFFGAEAEDAKDGTGARPLTAPAGRTVAAAVRRVTTQ